MKTAFYALLFCLCASCVSQTDPATKWCDCLQTGLAEYGLDMKGQRDAFFNALLEHGYVNSLDGHGMRLMLAKVSEGEPFPKEVKGLFEPLDVMSPAQIGDPIHACRFHLDSLENVASTADLILRWRSIADLAAESEQSGRHFSQSAMYRAMSEALTNDDLESDLFRTHFYIMVSAMVDTEQGILRQLPPVVEEPPVIERRQMFTVLVNADNQILAENELIKVGELGEKCKNWLVCNGVFEVLGESENCADRNWIELGEVEIVIGDLEKQLEIADDESLRYIEPELKKQNRLKYAIEYFGPFNQLAPYVIISMQNDVGTSYEMYIQVQNQLNGAINELRDELCLEHFGMSYEDLYTLAEEDEEARKKLYAIRMVHPQRISEAEPTTITD